jgi:16S rRNA (uracil1498-N3)-methyltransferase
MHRFITDLDLTLNYIELFGDVGHQVVDVLRMGEKEQVELLDGQGNSAVVEITEVKKHGATVHVVSRAFAPIDLSRRVVLYCAVLKKDNFEWVVQKATEVGVAEIVPIITDRTIKTGLRADRLEKIINEAVEQCGRNTLPKLREVVDYDVALREATGRKIFFHAGGVQLGDLKLTESEASIFIGPEGGWSEAEVESARMAGATIASLGNNILRGETAAVVAAWACVNK